MGDAEDRCAEERRLRRIEEAFTQGDLEALRAAVDDPGLIPNGRMHDAIGPCLIFAIYRSPIAFIRTLLDLGADPNAPADDGFPSLIAALSCAPRNVPGHRGRTDVDEIVRLLLARGADPNQRGINDYTPLHYAVDVRYLPAIPILLAGGADPDLRTRIDEYETALEMAEAARLPDYCAILAGRGKPLGKRLRSGLTLLLDVPGTGEPIRRQQAYRARLRMWLRRGEAVRWALPSGPVDQASLDDDGQTLITLLRIERRSLINGLFYGVEGMRVGGTRRLEIAPHLAYGDKGLPGTIPPGALLVAEITFLES